MERLCPECNEKLTGRIDMKFCSDQCRNTFNNSQNKDVTNYMRNVNNIIRKNRRILSALNPKNDAIKVHKNKLSDKGFNFKYHTSTYTTKKGSIYYFCYEHGYLTLEDDFYALVVRKEFAQ